MSAIYNTIDAYIAIQPKTVATILESIRATIRKAAPNAIEAISYNMPAYKYNGMLVYFAAYKAHIGFYALPSGNKAFQKKLSQYKTGKGSIQFPLDQPMPLELITQIVRFRIKENEANVKAKQK